MGIPPWFYGSQPSGKWPEGQEREVLPLPLEEVGRFCPEVQPQLGEPRGEVGLMGRPGRDPTKAGRAACGCARGAGDSGLHMGRVRLFLELSFFRFHPRFSFKLFHVRVLGVFRG